MSLSVLVKFLVDPNIVLLKSPSSQLHQHLGVIVRHRWPFSASASRAGGHTDGASPTLLGINGVGIQGTEVCDEWIGWLLKHKTPKADEDSRTTRLFSSRPMAIASLLLDTTDDSDDDALEWGFGYVPAGSWS
ncbi:hypothetical protein D9758_014385 [Tetrapyrgos nigripes]|uniref:Uncharacterized protein n=1 Tax=Tetrapyrgos nigripes TaxID=182062 RepID=A0A8H5CRU9_9AGAR|nr:hypothetical protein D9758_014385 [Tetrapyrgos nigripes]